MTEQNTLDLAAQLAAIQQQLTPLLQQVAPAAIVTATAPAQGTGLVRHKAPEAATGKVVYGLGVPVIVEMGEGRTAFCTAWIGPEHLVSASAFDAAIAYVEENIGRVYSKGDAKSGGLRRR